LLRRTFSLTSDVLATYETGVHNYMDYGLQLGRRFRALKLWFALRTYGVHGMQRAAARAHRARARARRLDRSRARLDRRRARIRSRSSASATSRIARSIRSLVDEHNLAIMHAVNATGEVFLSSTRLHGRVVLRIAIGNERTTARRPCARARPRSTRRARRCWKE
jgi:aromatic-L-amino-acid decarboxylase